MRQEHPGLGRSQRRHRRHRRGSQGKPALRDEVCAEPQQKGLQTSTEANCRCRGISRSFQHFTFFLRSASLPQFVVVSGTNECGLKNWRSGCLGSGYLPVDTGPQYWPQYWPLTPSLGQGSKSDAPILCLTLGFLVMSSTTSWTALLMLATSVLISL